MFVRKNCTMDMISNVNMVYDFHRRLSPEFMTQWNEIVHSIEQLPRTEEPDKVYWSFNKKGGLHD